MTLNELQNRYHNSSMSHDTKSKLKAKGYLDIIKEEYRQKILAARECVVQYATSDEISVILSRLSFDDKSLTNYLNYLKGAGYMNRIRYNDLLSAYNLLVL